EADRVPEAVKILDRFLADGLTGHSPDIYAHYEMILACSLASTGLLSEGQAHRDRAERIYQGLAHAPGLMELNRCWVKAAGEDNTQSPASPTNPATATTPGSITQSIAGLLLLADRPELLARGIVDLLRATAVVEHAAATVGNDDGEYDVLATINHDGTRS